MQEITIIKKDFFNPSALFTFGTQSYKTGYMGAETNYPIFNKLENFIKNKLRGLKKTNFLYIFPGLGSRT